MATNSSSEEKERKDGKPAPSLSFVFESVCNIWKVEVDEASIVQLESYDDANFYLRVKSSNENDEGEGEYLVKFYNSVDSNNMEMLNGISSLLNTVSSYKEEGERNGGRLFHHPLVPCPIIIPLNTQPNESSDCINLDVAFVQINSRKIGVRLFHWISGTTLNKIGTFMRILLSFIVYG
jgi:hypothetical protein